jgi:transglutaminase-like putative cysteine protease
MSLVLEIEHCTAYVYSGAVRMSQNEARVTPPSDARQISLHSDLAVLPRPRSRLSYRDYFGTHVEAFDITEPHDRLEVVGKCRVALNPAPSFDELRQVDLGGGDGLDEVVEYTLPSDMVRWNGEVKAIAEELRSDSAWSTVFNTFQWLQQNLTYERGQTDVNTAVAEVLKRRRGVCQDYAHLCCALLRSIGVPTRYVSGYFAPRPLDVGAELLAESHAWVEIFLPGWGWWPMDPTHNTPADRWRVKIGHGRDYRDVVPLKGVYVGEASQELTVTVRIRRLPDWHGGRTLAGGL